MLLLVFLALLALAALLFIRPAERIAALFSGAGADFLSNSEGAATPTRLLCWFGTSSSSFFKQRTTTTLKPSGKITDWKHFKHYILSGMSSTPITLVLALYTTAFAALPGMCRRSMRTGVQRALRGPSRPVSSALSPDGLPTSYSACAQQCILAHAPLSWRACGGRACCARLSPQLAPSRQLACTWWQGVSRSVPRISGDRKSVV